MSNARYGYKNFEKVKVGILWQLPACSLEESH
jgi:hypothetical protein